MQTKNKRAFVLIHLARRWCFLHYKNERTVTSYMDLEERPDSLCAALTCVRSSSFLLLQSFFVAPSSSPSLSFFFFPLFSFPPSSSFSALCQLESIETTIPPPWPCDNGTPLLHFSGLRQRAGELTDCATQKCRTHFLLYYF